MSTFDKKLKGKIKLEMPSYNSKNEELCERIEAYKIHITFGGGMGGGSKTIYSKTLVETDKYFMIQDMLTGENIKVFPNSIASITEVYLLEVKFYTESFELDRISVYDVGRYGNEDITFYPYTGKTSSRLIA
jgi:hypothetical protein